MLVSAEEKSCIVGSLLSLFVSVATLRDRERARKLRKCKRWTFRPGTAILRQKSEQKRCSTATS